MLSNPSPRSMSGTSAERPPANSCRAGTFYFDTNLKSLFVCAKIGGVHVWEPGFVVGNPGDWAGAPPATISAAIDRLAAAVAGILGTPVP